MGAALDVILAAVEDRFRALIFLDGGVFSEKPLPGADQADFVAYINVPTLLISVKFKWIFLGKDALIVCKAHQPRKKGSSSTLRTTSQSSKLTQAGSGRLAGQIFGQSQPKFQLPDTLIS